MKTRHDAIKSAVTSRSNVNTWAAIIELLEGGLLTGPTEHYEVAQRKVIKIAKEQIRADLRRYDLAMGKANAEVRDRSGSGTPPQNQTS